jgi:hypothetical protein
MNPWKIIAPCSVASFAVALAAACAPAAPPGPAACNNQPNMAGAVGSLQRARGYLERAEHNKGGWRDAAIRATDTALHETIRGCQFADTH